MAAPLYSRYKRYIDRDVRVYQKSAPKMARLIRNWKKSSTLVYSLSRNASYEAGWFSTEPPKVLLDALQSLYLPKEEVWVEVDWRAVMAGSLRIDIDHPDVDELYGEAPVRMGLLAARGDTENNSFVIMGYFLWATGRVDLGPVITEIDKSCELRNNRDLRDLVYKKVGFDIDEAGIGLGYRDRYAEEHPRLYKKLAGALDLLLPGRDPNAPHSLTAYVRLMKEVHGTARLYLAILAALVAAQPPRYVPDGEAPPRERKDHSGTAKAPYEIDLFLRSKPKPGRSIAASLRAVERRKKMAHTVGGHYAYRARKDGGDPTVCTVSDHHDFEKIEGTKSEVCIFCDQRRWWKAEHERGDETLGRVGQKVRNIRVGEKMHSSAQKGVDEPIHGG
jgi:hypothetical protein